MSSSVIRIAAAKGYLLSDAIAALAKVGIHFDPNFSSSRSLSTFDESGTVQLFQIRPWDVPVYVQEGAADLGVVGKDVLLEQSPNCLDLLDLGFGACRLILAGLDTVSRELTHNMKVATKYPNATSQYFRSKGLKVKLIKLYGAIELAPVTQLADIICDLTATGTSLKENHLVEIDALFSSTAHLVANPVSMKAHYDRIVELVDALRAVVNG
ncbi:MAG: ATP phosphoribosyltransferase [Actinobacteria bacterium]|nr:ATP phosphoribosyltransferase [Actinomycetota bacterium]